jgi:membrane dipeptidase
MPRITDALLARGWSDDDVRAYLGGNFKRVLGEIWGG